MPIRYPDPPGYVPDVMTKVYRALEDAGLEDREVQDAISEMQNEGVLFRERDWRLDGGDARTVLNIMFDWINEQPEGDPDASEVLHRLRQSGYCCCTTEFGCVACGGKKTSPPVHNHGPEEGAGLSCSESRLPDGSLQGACISDEKGNEIMAHTSHGHPIPGAPIEKGPKPDATRCGGQKSCPRCQAEIREFHELYNVSVTPRETVVPMNVPDDFPSKAKKILVDYIDSHYSTSFEKPAFEVYVVWFVKVLQHWKALVSTDRPDGRYYELTFNGDRNEVYIDEYGKLKNTVVSLNNR
ncbi:hypothetical protein SEA_MADAMATO_66 [Streptomyces phage Madamato]|nr:hypothetical protein SEA_MADAMATO_66 [Streptomyces phage Madamato]